MVEREPPQRLYNMENKTVARIQTRDSLITLIHSRDRFREALLSDHQLPAWITEECEEETDSDARRTAADISLRLTYTPEQPGQETRKLTGLIGISKETLELGAILNQSKQQFKETVQNYRKMFGSSFEMTDLSSKDLRETVLGNMNIQHIHFVQCYRQLKLFPTAPRRVGFSWASGTHGSVRLPVGKAIEHLRSKFTPSVGLAEDIRLLEKMPMAAEVVIRRPLVPHLRANLTWPDEIRALKKADPEKGKQWPGQINTPLPLFIYSEPGAELPEFNRIRPWNPDNRQDRLKRSDTRLVPLSHRPGSMLYRPI